MQDVRSDDPASRIGALIGTILVLGVIAVIGVDVLNALGRLYGA